MSALIGRRIGCQLVDEDHWEDAASVAAARAAMDTPLARAATEALMVVADQHHVTGCDADECYFPRCIADGCEACPDDDHEDAV